MKLRILFFLLITKGLLGQETKIISNLLYEIQNKKLTDTAKINRYILLSKSYSLLNNDSAFKYATLAKNKSNQINYKAGLGHSMYALARAYYFSADFELAKKELELAINTPASKSDIILLQKEYNLLGATEFNLGNYINAEKNYKKNLEISIILKDTSSIISAYYNHSLIFNSQGDYSKALEYNFLVLNLAEKTNDTINILLANNGLGIAYYGISENKKSILYLKKAYKIALEKNMLFEQAGIFIDMGSAYAKDKKFETAILYNDRAIMLSEKISDKRAMATALINKSSILIALEKPNEAILFLNKSLAICKEIKYLRGELDNYNVLSIAYYDIGEITKSKEYSEQLMNKATKVGVIDLVKDSYYNLYKVHDKLNNTEKAYFYFKKYIQLKDSFINEDKYIKIASREFEYQKQKEDQLILLEKKIAFSELEKQKQIKNIIIVASFILLILLAFAIKSFIDKQKANNEITKKNKEIEEKNKDITDSINYSKNIQDVILTPEAEVKKYLPNSFILFNPKDIVSGDFYFIERIKDTINQNTIAIALADCTGHGVPGAFMSIIGYTILRQSLKEKNINLPSHTLDFLNKELQVFLRQNENKSHIKDGMDIAFCTLNLQSQFLSYAGANNPLWIISKQKKMLEINENPLFIPYPDLNNDFIIYELKPDKQPIGFGENIKDFTNHTIQLQKGDFLYLFTDGYADQFGGEKGKKFKYKQLAKLLISNVTLDVIDQKACINEAFINWKQTNEQVDDVCIIGIGI